MRRPRLVHLVPSMVAGFTVSFWAARWLHRPPRGEDSPVVSFATILGYRPLDNVILYFAGLVLAAGLAVLLARLDADRAHGMLTRAFEWLAQPRVVPWLGAALLAAFVVNNSFGNPSGPMTDLFHEGESLGFRPVFRQLANPFEHAFLIHGFGMDVLPTLAADLLSRPGRGIAVSRAFRMAEQAVTWLALLWLVIEVARWAAPGEHRAERAAAIAAFCLAHPFLYYVTVPRSPVSFAQAAATLRFLRIERRGDASRWSQTALSFALGLSLPLALLYNYSEAVAFVAVFVAASVVAALQGRGAFSAWWRGTALGAAAGTTVLLVALGPSQVWAMLSTVAYWMKLGGWIWLQPIVHTAALNQRYFWVIVSVHLLAAVHLWETVRRPAGWRASLTEQADVWIVLAFSVASMKTWVDRPDSPHLALGAILAAALLVSLGLRWWMAAAPGTSPAHRGLLVAGTAALLLIGGGPTQFDPTAAWARLVEFRLGQRTLDASNLTQDVGESILRLGPQIASQQCFFTLTSEGVWYYLFDKPSCSRFHQLVYARTAEAQREVIEDLRRGRPDLILFRNDSFSNAVDGVSVANSNHLVYAYVLSDYRPDQRVAQHWFWRRASGPLRMRAAGVPGRVEKTTPGFGTLELQGWVSAAGAAFLYVAHGDELIEVVPLAPGDTSRARFRVSAPVAFLGPGEQTLRLAVYDPRTDELVPLEDEGTPVAVRWSSP